MTFPNSNNQGTPASPETPGQGTSGGATAPTYITQEALEAKLTEFQKAFQDSLNNTYRGIQSLSGKIQSQLSNLDSIVKQMQAAGQPVDPNVIQRMKTDIISSAYSDESPPPMPKQAPGQGQPPAQAESNDVVIRKIEAYQEAIGAELFDDDPELEMLPMDDFGSPAFFVALNKALTAKKAREASDTPQRAIARSPMIGSTGQPASNALQGVKGEALWDLAFNKPRK